MTTKAKWMLYLYKNKGFKGMCDFINNSANPNDTEYWEIYRTIKIYVLSQLDCKYTLKGESLTWEELGGTNIGTARTSFRKLQKEK